VVRCPTRDPSRTATPFGGEVSLLDRLPPTSLASPSRRRSAPEHARFVEWSAPVVSAGLVVDEVPLLRALGRPLARRRELVAARTAQLVDKQGVERVEFGLGVLTRLALGLTQIIRPLGVLGGLRNRSLGRLSGLACARGSCRGLRVCLAKRALKLGDLCFEPGDSRLRLLVRIDSPRRIGAQPRCILEARESGQQRRTFAPRDAPGLLKAFVLLGRELQRKPPPKAGTKGGGGGVMCHTSHLLLSPIPPVFHAVF